MKTRIEHRSIFDSYSKHEHCALLEAPSDRLYAHPDILEKLQMDIHADNVYYCYTIDTTESASFAESRRALSTPNER